MSLEIAAAKGLAEGAKIAADLFGNDVGKLVSEQTALQNLNAKFTQVDTAHPATRSGLELREIAEGTSEQKAINNLRNKFENPSNTNINTTLDTSRECDMDYRSPETQGWNSFYVGDCNGRSFFKITEGQNTEILNASLCENAVFESPTQSGNTITSWTDELGRIEKMNIDKIECYDGVRDLNQQKKCNELKNGLTSDDAGHLLAREFGGPTEQFNLTPMDSHTNRHGEWRYMEQEWKQAMNDGKSISDINYQIYYDGDSKRPTGFDISYKVDGETEIRYVDNSPTIPSRL